MYINYAAKPCPKFCVQICATWNPELQSQGAGLCSRRCESYRCRGVNLSRSVKISLNMGMSKTYNIIYIIYIYLSIYLYIYICVYVFNIQCQYSSFVFCRHIWIYPRYFKWTSRFLTFIDFSPVPDRPLGCPFGSVHHVFHMDTCRGRRCGPSQKRTGSWWWTPLVQWVIPCYWKLHFRVAIWGVWRMLVWWSDKPPWRCELLIDHFTCTLDQWEVFVVRCQGYPCTSQWLVATTGLCTTSSWHKSARFILQSFWAIPSSLFLLPCCNRHIRPGKLGHTESDDARCSLDTWGPLQHLDGSVRCNSPQTSEVGDSWLVLCRGYMFVLIDYAFHVSVQNGSESVGWHQAISNHLPGLPFYRWTGTQKVAYMASYGLMWHDVASSPQLP